MDRIGISNRETPEEEQRERQRFEPLHEQAGSGRPEPDGYEPDEPPDMTVAMPQQPRDSRSTRTPPSASKVEGAFGKEHRHDTDTK